MQPKEWVESTCGLTSAVGVTVTKSVKQGLSKSSPDVGGGNQTVVIDTEPSEKRQQHEIVITEDQHWQGDDRDTVKGDEITDAPLSVRPLTLSKNDVEERCRRCTDVVVGIQDGKVGDEDDITAHINHTKDEYEVTEQNKATPATADPSDTAVARPWHHNTSPGEQMPQRTGNVNDTQKAKEPTNRKPSRW